MILVIDNYDSFTYNLVQYLGELSGDIEVYRNDKITSDQIRELHPDRIVVSPGPGRPEDAGISVQLIQELGSEIPILGICLGHQCIGQAYGGKIVSAPEIIHGKTSQIYYNGEPLFRGTPKPFDATRYHSLMVEKDTLPNTLMITAETNDGVIMGLSHRQYPVKGMQFHPESIATKHGMQILENFLEDSQ